MKNIKSHNNINYAQTINRISNKESESFSSSCSSSINYESDSNNNENILESENQTKKTDTLKSVKIYKNTLENIMTFNNIIENKSKILKIKQNIKINIKRSYLNLNEITKGKFAKSKRLQECIKNIVIKKILKHRKESQVPKKRKSLGVNRRSMQALKQLQTLGIPKNVIQGPKRRKSFSVTKKFIQSPRKRHSFSINKKISQTPKKRCTQVSNKLLKNKTLAKNIPKRYLNNIKSNVNNDKIKKTDVKSKFKFNIVSDIHERNSAFNIMRKANIMRKDNIMKSDNSLDSSKRKKNSDEFLLDYVNKNIKNDNAVLNNPDKFYNGLFGAIMRKVNQTKMIQDEDEEEEEGEE